MSEYEMNNINEGFDEAEDDEDSIITLTDDDGKEVSFELLDLIDYSNAQYAVVLPAEEDADQVLVFKVENPESETNTFIPVTSQSTAMAVFNLFKEKNKEFFDFE